MRRGRSPSGSRPGRLTKNSMASGPRQIHRSDRCGGRLQFHSARQHPPAVRARRDVGGGRLRRLHRRPALAPRIRGEGFYHRPDRQGRRGRQGGLRGKGARHGLVGRKALCASDHRPQLRDVLSLRPARRGRALRRPRDLGRVPRMGEEAHQGRRLRHADRRQAGHRGDDASPLLHPAGGRRHPRRQQQAGLRFRCWARGVRVHAERRRRGQVEPAGRPRLFRHDGPVARRQARDGADVAAYVCDEQGSRTRRRSSAR